jgi:hypothetical protein
MNSACSVAYLQRPFSSSVSEEHTIYTYTYYGPVPSVCCVLLLYNNGIQEFSPLYNNRTYYRIGAKTTEYRCFVVGR